MWECVLVWGLRHVEVAVIFILSLSKSSCPTMSVTHFARLKRFISELRPAAMATAMMKMRMRMMMLIYIKLYIYCTFMPIWTHC